MGLGQNDKTHFPNSRDVQVGDDLLGGTAIENDLGTIQTRCAGRVLGHE